MYLSTSYINQYFVICFFLHVWIVFRVHSLDVFNCYQYLSIPALHTQTVISSMYKVVVNTQNDRDKAYSNELLQTRKYILTSP